MNKIMLYLDFDDCLTDTLVCLLNILNKKYKKDIIPYDVKRWDLRDAFPHLTTKELENCWEMEEFWHNLKLKKNALKMLKEMQYHANICIVSKGTDKNLSMKKKWIKENIVNKGVNLIYYPIALDESKSLVPMKPCDIMIDDNIDYLNECSAGHKILFFHHAANWNKGHEKVPIITNWGFWTRHHLKSLVKIINKERGYKLYG